MKKGNKIVKEVVRITLMRQLLLEYFLQKNGHNNKRHFPSLSGEILIQKN